jgi:hypothetical protein
MQPRVWLSTKQPKHKGNLMESQVFSPASFSLRPVDLIPDDTTDEDVRWSYYCETAGSLDPSDLLEIVLDECRAGGSPLLEAIQDAIQYPYEPGCPPKANVSDLLRLGKKLIAIIAKAVDDQVTLRQMGQEVRHD